MVARRLLIEEDFQITNIDGYALLYVIPFIGNPPKLNMTNLLDFVVTYTLKGYGVRQIQCGQQETTRSKQGELLHCTARLPPQNVALTETK